jgi:hypothetical protein
MSTKNPENIKPQDLLEIVEYDLGSIDGNKKVSPWGFRPEALDTVKAISGNFHRIIRSSQNFVQLTHGEICIATAVAAVMHPTVDAYCIVIVRGMRLGVNLRFLKKLCLQ